MKRPFRKRNYKATNTRLVAYDFETTNIKVGTPDPLYITAFGENFKLSKAINKKSLLSVLQSSFLIPEFLKTRFVAWNANKYDVYFIALSLMESPDYILRPYLTSGKQLRGLRVELVPDMIKSWQKRFKLKIKRMYWEFLDGMAMTGLQCALKKFLKLFCPDYEKFSRDFSKSEFDPSDPKDILYAERDSEGLYHGMMNAQKIIETEFQLNFKPTMGNLAIKIFSKYIPEKVLIYSPPKEAIEIIKENVMRGGYCHIMTKYKGQTWKYDINQAYASVMRNPLPWGRCIRIVGKMKPKKLGIYEISAYNVKNFIPFYFRKDRRGIFENNHLDHVWLTSVEIEQLQKENWDLIIHEGYYWERSFTMSKYVDHLEKLRMTAEGGPSGAKGTMIKSIGNNSYGKTVETLDGIELVWSKDRPEGFNSYMAEDPLMKFVWFRKGEAILREYHQPQIGSFITAYVRMVVRAAIMLKPSAFLYADTDCVAFKEPVNLPIDAGRYGHWKLEVDGLEYQFIDKKVYCDLKAEVKHAKGMNLNNLTKEDFDQWFEGNPPKQKQLHRNNFLKVMAGIDMFVEREKVGAKNKN